MINPNTFVYPQKYSSPTKTEFPFIIKLFLHIKKKIVKKYKFYAEFRYKKAYKKTAFTQIIIQNLQTESPHTYNIRNLRYLRFDTNLDFFCIYGVCDGQAIPYGSPRFSQLKCFFFFVISDKFNDLAFRYQTVSGIMRGGCACELSV